MPAGVIVTGDIFAVVPSAVWLTSSLKLAGNVISTTGKKYRPSCCFSAELSSLVCV